MTIQRRTLRTGDLLEIRSDNGVAYIQVVGRHSEYGIAIYVFPRWYPKRLGDFQELGEARGYVTFYPAEAAVREGLAEIIESCPLPSGVEMPRVLRRAGARAPNGEILTWVIEDDGRERLREKITDGEKRIPIAAIWNHALLIERISKRWRPEEEG